MFSSEHVIHNRQSTSRVRACESGVHPALLALILHLQHMRVRILRIC